MVNQTKNKCIIWLGQFHQFQIKYNLEKEKKVKQKNQLTNMTTDLGSMLDKEDEQTYMTQSKIFEKWTPILKSIKDNKNIRWDHKSVFPDNLYNMPINSSSTSSFTGILPMASRIASQTIAMDLVSVVPMGTVTEEIENEVKSINRERKIESIVDDKEFKEMKVSDHPDYNGPKGKLMYLDFKYGGTSI